MNSSKIDGAQLPACRERLNTKRPMAISMILDRRYAILSRKLYKMPILKIVKILTNPFLGGKRIGRRPQG